MMANIGLFDMDGTLFDYEGQLRKDLRLLMSPGEEEPETLWDESKPWIKQRMAVIKRQPGWWRNLPKFQLGWDILEVAKRIGFDLKILTKGPASNPIAWAEKVECISHHFDGSMNIDIVGQSKSGQYGRFLCDDYPDYMKGWLTYRPRGLGVLIANKDNEGFDHPNVIRYDGTNLLAIEHVLIDVYEREPGQAIDFTWYKEYYGI
jgi:5'-nucleotidase